jgi:transcriptional regulator with XRE-family HTH domain
MAGSIDLKEMMIMARVQAGLMQWELAELMSTSQSTISRLESGRDTPTLTTLQKWAEVTGKQLEIRLV